MLVIAVRDLMFGSKIHAAAERLGVAILNQSSKLPQRMLSDQDCGLKRLPGGRLVPVDRLTDCGDRSRIGLCARRRASRWRRLCRPRGDPEVTAHDATQVAPTAIRLQL